MKAAGVYGALWMLIAALFVLMPGIDLAHYLRQVFPVDVTGALEDFERGPAERRLAASVEDVAGQRHAEFVSHRVLP